MEHALSSTRVSLNRVIESKTKMKSWVCYWHEIIIDLWRSRDACREHQVEIGVFFNKKSSLVYGKLLHAIR